jgi:hypothetical protein
MGRLPTHFAGREISFRIPYQIPGELQVGPGQTGVVFPEATFLHNVDKPFEIHRSIFRNTAMINFQYVGQTAVSLQPSTEQPVTIDKLIRLRITDVSKNENLTKSSTLSDSLVKSNERTWEWEEPYTLVRSEGFQVQVDSQLFPAVCVQPEENDPAVCETVPIAIDFIRVEVSFQGYLIVVAPPSETR